MVTKVTKKSLNVMCYCFLCILLFGCSSIAHSEKKNLEARSSQSTNEANSNERKVIDVWKETIKNHSLSKENIVFTEELLAELGADTIILSKNDQIRMNKSLDRYLKQFGYLYKEFNENSSLGESFYLEHKTNPSEGACYWLAWMISRGAREKKLTEEQKEEILTSYKSFTNEVTSLIEKGLYSSLKSEDYEKYSPYITKNIDWLKTRYDDYYRELHDDFLYPCFDEPFEDKVKKSSVDTVRSFREVPNLYSFERSKHIIEEETYIKELQGYVSDVPVTLMWSLSMLSIQKDITITEEWGYMDFRSNSCKSDELWPFVVQIIPIEEVNKLEKIGRWKEQ